MKREKIEVSWLDSHSRYGWESEESARRAADELRPVCTTVGYKLLETEEFLFIVMSQGEPDLIHTSMAIPKVAILKTRKLK